MLLTDCVHLDFSANDGRGHKRAENLAKLNLYALRQTPDDLDIIGHCNCPLESSCTGHCPLSRTVIHRADHLHDILIQ